MAIEKLLAYFDSGWFCYFQFLKIVIVIIVIIIDNNNNTIIV